MLDYNHRPKFHERVGAVIDEALARERASQTPRRYLGASRLGVACVLFFLVLGFLMLWRVREEQAPSHD